MVWQARDGECCCSRCLAAAELCDVWAEMHKCFGCTLPPRAQSSKYWNAQTKAWRLYAYEPQVKKVDNEEEDEQEEHYEEVNERLTTLPIPTAAELPASASSILF